MKGHLCAVRQPVEKLKLLVGTGMFSATVKDLICIEII